MDSIAHRAARNYRDATRAVQLRFPFPLVSFRGPAFRVRADLNAESIELSGADPPRANYGTWSPPMRTSCAGQVRGIRRRDRQTDALSCASSGPSPLPRAPVRNHGVSAGGKFPPSDPADPASRKLWLAATRQSFEDVASWQPHIGRISIAPHRESGNRCLSRRERAAGDNGTRTC